MLSIIRNTANHQVVYISYGSVTHTPTGILDDSIPDAPTDFWGTDDGYEKIQFDTEPPEDYVGGKYKLVNDGDGYRWELLPEVTE